MLRSAAVILALAASADAFAPGPMAVA